MARMHSRDKGKAGSTKPIKKIPSWMTYKEKEIEKLIIKLAKAGKTPSEIGVELRDSYGVNSVRAATQKKITKILEENQLLKELPEDLMALIKKLAVLKAHFEKNNHDQTSKRGLLLTDSKIRRLTKYYKKTNKLPQDWKLDIKKIGMYLE